MTDYDFLGDTPPPPTKGIDDLHAPAPPEADPMDEPEWTFEFSFTAPRGKVFAGTFTNRILSVGETQDVGSLRGRMANGVPWAQLDPTTAALNQAISHMRLSFWDTERKNFRGPAWARDLRKLFDHEVIWLLWEKVRAHEARFFRLGEDQAGGEEE